MFGPLEIPQESLLLQRFAGNEPILEAKKRTLPQIWNLQNMEIFVISTTSYRNLQGKSLTNWMNITFLERIILDKRCTKYFLNKKFYQKKGFATRQRKHIVIGTWPNLIHIPSNKPVKSRTVWVYFVKKYFVEKYSKNRNCFGFCKNHNKKLPKSEFETSAADVHRFVPTFS